MLSENAVALKEWASLCAALSAGRQCLLLRKGGIAEGPGGFRMEHDEFWLFPTQFHQSPEQLTPEGNELLRRVQASPPVPGQVPIASYALVKAVAFLADERRLDDLRGWHLISDEVLNQRFHYRQPGLYVAAVEVFRLPDSLEIADLPRYAGCHSWVELESPLSTRDLSAVQPSRTLEMAIELVQSLS
jgi:hypothetical protein